jgi:hypothetical protein
VGHVGTIVALGNLAFLGALVGSFTRPLAGWLADRTGGAKITLVVFVSMAGGIALIMAALKIHNFPMYLVAFLAWSAWSARTVDSCSSRRCGCRTSTSATWPPPSGLCRPVFDNGHGASSRRACGRHCRVAGRRRRASHCHACGAAWSTEARTLCRWRRNSQQRALTEKPLIGQPTVPTTAEPPSRKPR